VLAKDEEEKQSISLLTALSKEERGQRKLYLSLLVLQIIQERQFTRQCSPTWRAHYRDGSNERDTHQLEAHRYERDAVSEPQDSSGQDLEERRVPGGEMRDGCSLSDHTRGERTQTVSAPDERDSLRRGRRAGLP
jgi:hypothetical protein